MTQTIGKIRRIREDGTVDARCPTCRREGRPTREITVRCSKCQRQTTATVHEHPMGDNGTSLALYGPACRCGGTFRPMEPCRVCGEELTPGGRTCPRCERNLQEERDG